MTLPRLVAWERDDEAAGHSMAHVEADANGWVAHGTEVLAGPGPQLLLSCTFTIHVDDRWAATDVTADAVSALGSRSVRLRADGAGHWQVDGSPAPHLTGCVDIDIAATPLTNTFPIRRLTDLPVGRSVTSPVAWVDVPSLQVQRVDQTYRRLGLREWEYGDPDHGTFALTVDDDGLVVDYAGFARRVAG